MKTELQFRAAVNKQINKGQEKILAAIEAKKVKSSQATTQQVTDHAEQKAAAEIVIGGLTSGVIQRLLNKANKLLPIITILTLVLAGCSAANPTPAREIPINNNSPSDEVGPSLSDPLEAEGKNVEEENPVALNTAVLETTATIEEIKDLNTSIASKMSAAAEGSDLVTKTQYYEAQRAETASEIFAEKLASPTNKEDRLINPNSFEIKILPGGQACIILTEDNIWGKAGEVVLIDIGEAEPMLVTLETGLEAVGISISETTNYELVPGETSEGNTYWYAVIREKSTGNIVAVVGTDREWQVESEVTPLEPPDVMPLIAAAYLEGELEQRDITKLSAENRVKFETSLAAAEANLSFEEQKAFIERTYIHTDINRGIVNAAGQLEVFDGQKGEWLTPIEPIITDYGVLPFGESFDTQNPDDMARLDQYIPVMTDEGLGLQTLSQKITSQLNYMSELQAKRGHPMGENPQMVYKEVRLDFTTRNVFNGAVDTVEADLIGKDQFGRIAVQRIKVAFWLNNWFFDIDGTDSFSIPGGFLIPREDLPLILFGFPNGDAIEGFIYTEVRDRFTEDTRFDEEHNQELTDFFKAILKNHQELDVNGEMDPDKYYMPRYFIDPSPSK